jgi:hypothetical protein
VPPERDCEAAAIPATLCVCANDQWENVTLPLNDAATVDQEERELARVDAGERRARLVCVARLAATVSSTTCRSVDDFQRLAVIAVAHINNKHAPRRQRAASAMPCGQQPAALDCQAPSLKEWVKSGRLRGPPRALAAAHGADRRHVRGGPLAAACGARSSGRRKFTGGVDVVRVTRVSRHGSRPTSSRV